MLIYLLWLFVAIVATLVAVLAARAHIVRRNARNHRPGLFRYSDGKRTRSIDPIAAYLALEGHPEFRFDLHPKQAAEDGDSESINIVARAVRDAFDVPEFTEPGKPGLTVQECHHLLREFVGFLVLQKKSIDLPATAPLSTAATSSESCEPTTNCSLPSGSTASALE